MPIRGKFIEDRGQFTRRAIVVGSLAAGGLAASAPALALQDRALTGESPMGPFYPLTHPADSDADLVWLKGHAQRATGQVIEVSGRVLDPKGNPIANAAIELWQANAAGRYDHPSDPAKAPLDPHFQGFAAIRSNAKGEWRITTIKPAGYDSPIGHRPPHIHFDVRGRTHRNLAQLYFPEEAEGNAKDRLYKMLGAEAATSLAQRNPADPNKYVWDIVLMG